MADFDLVQVLNACENLVEKATGFLVGQSLLLNDQIKQFTIRHEFHNQEQLPRSLNNLVQLHNVRMSDNLKNLDLPHNSRYIGLLLDFVLLQYFDGHLLLCQCVRAESDFAKCALPDRLAYTENQ